MLRRASALTVLALLGPVAAAHADGVTTAAPASPAAASAPTPPKAKPAPAAGALTLYFSRPLLYRKQAFGIVGRPVVVRAVVAPPAPGEHVVISAYRRHHRVMRKVVAVRAHGPRGVAAAAFATGKAGPVRFTATLGAVHAKARRLRVHSYNVSFGAKGAVVDLIQRKLARLHYRSHATGTFDGTTGRALLAYRKVNGMARTQSAGRAVIGRLIRGKGAFTARYPSHGRHVEADLSRQVAALIDPHGKVYATFAISSGKPSTPTVLGHYSVYLKTPGTNSEGMFDSNYFIRGYALHGYPDVPTYAASHGCLRAFNADAPFLYAWVHIGTGVDVYP